MSDSGSERIRQVEFDLVRAALSAAGLPSDDFGRFTSDRHRDMIRPSIFDYRSAISVLLPLLTTMHHPDVLESIVRSLSTGYARPVAAVPLIQLFKNTTRPGSSSLKWSIGNALSVVSTPAHKEALLELALDPRHGSGRQMIVERLGRISSDPRIVDALQALSTDPDVALHAQAGLRRRLGQVDAEAIIRPLLAHPSPVVRNAAIYNLRQAARAARRRVR